jgi:hypothetical protein
MPWRKPLPWTPSNSAGVNENAHFDAMGLTMLRGGSWKPSGHMSG